MTSVPGESATLLIESQSGFEPVSLKPNSTIGRDRKCDVFVDHPTASRMHGRIWQDDAGWHYQDLGSANGTKLGESKLQAQIDLSNGTALRIGRVQAYFFSGQVPDTWKPPEQAGRAGKLLRCKCGHIGWAPQYTLGMTLHCAKCGKDLVHNDSQTRRTVSVECAACHTPIAPSEKMHTCDECGAQLHDTCFTELGGCATYGCSRVKHDSPSGSADMHESAIEPESARGAQRGVPTDFEAVRFHLAQCGLFIILGLAAFGVPAIAFAAYRLVTYTPTTGRLRFLYAAMAFVGGAVGFITSAWWWLGGPRPWRLL